MSQVIDDSLFGTKLNEFQMTNGNTHTYISYKGTLVISVFCLFLFVMEDTHDGFQCLLLALCPDIISERVQGTIRGAGD